MPAVIFHNLIQYTPPSVLLTSAMRPGGKRKKKELSFILETGLKALVDPVVLICNTNPRGSEMEVHVRFHLAVLLFPHNPKMYLSTSVHIFKNSSSLITLSERRQHILHSHWILSSFTQDAAQWTGAFINVPFLGAVGI